LEQTGYINSRQLLALNLVWWTTSCIIHFSILILSMHELGYAAIFSDSFTTFLLLGICSYFTMSSMRYYLPRHEKYWYVLVISLAISGVCVFLNNLIQRLFFSGDLLFIKVIQQSVGLRFGISFLLVTCMLLVSLLWHTQNEQRQIEKRRGEADQLTREAELFKLRQQLQPHFLFNSLNSINALIAIQPDQARKMIQQLSDFLRGTLKKEDQQWVILSEELQYLQLYLDIEKVRFGHRLSDEIKSDESARSMKLPPMLLQPIVENAIKFGLYDTIDDVVIRINARSQDNYLEIVVENPFDPATSHPKPGTGFGLRSVQRRLFLLFARNDLLRTRTDRNLFITTVKIPQVL
jgi:two-component system LytT family sensor kinase